MSPGHSSNIVQELEAFSNAEGEVFSRMLCKENRTKMQPDRWWQMFGPKTPNLQQVAIRILSQPCSASGCERNWSMFEHIHSKRRNRLSVERLNDLVFVHYNLCLRHKQVMDHDSTPITLEEVDPESEWISEATDPMFGDEDLDWIDEVDREAEVVAMAEEEVRARGEPEPEPEPELEPELEPDTADVCEGRMESRAESMAVDASRTYLRVRRLRRKDPSSFEP
ncbi:uncharacterized protein LOC131038091 [Cryptomeria japonica]|uniref:uncharacterized protein LOC131038091 n=1 Tax=Cryptomeria japonica TaxID=3369 RepID=UPI0027DA1CBD|nr:uncharacterized protein LOC131038091 [Cryptomeria japonica]